MKKKKKKKKEEEKKKEERKKDPPKTKNKQTSKQTNKQTKKKKKKKQAKEKHEERSRYRSEDGLVVEQRNRDRKVLGLSPGRRSGRMFFPRVNCLCWGRIFRHSFPPRVTAVARKRSRSFCQNVVTAKRTYTLRMWLRIVTL